MTSISWREMAGAADDEPTPILPGDYDAVLDHADIGTTSTDKEMFKCTFHIDGGAYKGRSVKTNLVVSPESSESLGILFRQLGNLGIPKEWVADISGSEELAEELRERYCVLRLKPGKGQYSHRMDVADILKPNGHTNRAPGTPRPPQLPSFGNEPPF